MAKKKTMKFNEVYVSGEVLDIIDVKKLNKGTGNEAVTFKLKVETGKNESNIAEFYCNKFLNNGSPNQIYLRTIDVANTIQTRAENEKGDLVSISAQLDKNSFVTKSGDVVRNIKINGTFCNLEKDSKYPIKPNQSFKVYTLIEEINKVDDYLLVKGLVNKYAYISKKGKKANGMEVEFRVYGELVNDFNEFYKVGDIALLSGKFKTLITQSKGKSFGNRNTKKYENYLEIEGGDEAIASIVKDEKTEEVELEVIDPAICGKEEFPFTLEYIELMREAIKKEEEKLQKKLNELESEEDEEDEEEDDPFTDDEEDEEEADVPF